MWNHSDTDRQNAVYKDFAAFMKVYPEVKDAVDKAIGAVVRTRPPDPFVFIAQKLREINNDMKLEKLEMEEAAIKIQRRAKGMKDRKRVKAIKEEKEKQQEIDEQSKAAVKIQAMQRKKKDMKKVEQMKSNNQVWLRELYRKMVQHTKDFLNTEMKLAGEAETSTDVNAQAIAQSLAQSEEAAAVEQKEAAEGEAGAAEGGGEGDKETQAAAAAAAAAAPAGDEVGGREVLVKALHAFVSNDAEAKARMVLPERFLVSIPKQYSGMFKKIRSALDASDVDMESTLSWYQFAAYFGLSQELADHADLEASAVRIQALGRKRRDNKRVKELEAARRTMDTVAPSGEGAAAGGEGGVMGYTVDTAK